MVLGLPWLQKTNPEIDWKKRTVTLRKKASKATRGKIETPALSTKKAKKASTKTSQEARATPTGGKRGGYGGDEVPPKEEQILKEAKYQQELKETREKLPDELKDYAEVFCQRD